MTNYTITYNGTTARAHGLLVEHRPEIPSATAKTEKISIPARDGALHTADGTVNDVDISVDFAFVDVARDQWQETYRDAMEWLYSSGNGRLILSDDPAWYYQVVDVEVGSNVEYAHQSGGRFTAVFTVRGFAYAVSGDTPGTPGTEGEFPNQYDLCKPTYILTGDGYTTLTVNDKEMTINVSDEVVVDTDLMLARQGNFSRNTLVSGDYKDLWLNHGQNIVEATTVSGSVTLSIIPRWRRRL